jgi:hypothetical protein
MKAQRKKEAAEAKGSHKTTTKQSMHAAVLMMLQQEQTSLQKRGCFTENKIGDNTISCRERVTSSKPRSTIHRVRRGLHAGGWWG